MSNNLPDHWEEKKLGDVCSVLDSKRKPITKRNRLPGKYPYYGATGILDYVKDYIFDEQLILIGEDGAKWYSGANTAFIVKGKYWVNNHAHVIKPNRNIILDEWIVYFLNFSDLTKYVTGLTVPKLNQSKLRSILIFLPKVSEQKRIVKILDKAFENIDKAKTNYEQNLKNSKEIFENYLNNIFDNPGDDWEEKKLRDISNIQYGFTEKSNFNNIGPKFLRITDIQDNSVNWETVPFCKCNDEDIEKYKLYDGDIVFARTGATTGKSYIIMNPPQAVFASYLIRLQLNKKIKLLPKFLYMYFQSKGYWAKIKSGLSGSAQGGFNASKLGKLKLFFPSLQDQKQIVAKLDKLSEKTKKLESIYKQKIIATDELKKSILQKAFNGEL